MDNHKLEILKRRAELNKAPLEEERASMEAPITLLLAGLLGHTFAIEAKYVLEVIHIYAVTPIPGSPPYLTGVINHRGKIVPLISLKELLLLEERGLTEQNRIALISRDGVSYGLIFDSIIGVEIKESTTLERESSALLHNVNEFVSGIFPDDTIMLNSFALTNSPKIIKNR